MTVVHRPGESDGGGTEEGYHCDPRFDGVPTLVKEVHLAGEVEPKEAEPGERGCKGVTRGGEEILST